MSRRIPTGVWLQEKFQRLNETTEIMLQDDKEQYGEPEYGFWSLKKEIALMYWIWPFLTIASAHFKSFYYIDLFAGSGLMKANEYYFVGSPIVALASTLPDKQFHEYICIEIDPFRSETLKKRAKIASRIFSTPLPKVFNFDCNEKLPGILNDFCPKGETCFLAFIDPEKIKDLKWETVYRLLIHSKGDLIITFPTQGIIRNFQMAKQNEKLGSLFSAFFGDDKWKNVAASADIIVDYYKRKISQTGSMRRSVDSFTVRDESNRRLYDLIFATGSRGMANVMRDLKIRLDRIKTKDIRAINQVIAESQTQITNFSQSSD